MHHERASEAAAGKQLAQFQMMLVKPAHKAQLDQPAAHRAFRMDNREACFGRHGERLFAENRFARPEAGERIRLVGGAGGGNHNSVHPGRGDQRFRLHGMRDGEARGNLAGAGRGRGSDCRHARAG